MNNHKALKEVLPWAKPTYEDKIKTKRLAAFTQSYLENQNPILKKRITRIIKELREG